MAKAIGLDLKFNCYLTVAASTALMLAGLIQAMSTEVMFLFCSKYKHQLQFLTGFRRFALKSGHLF